LRAENGALAARHARLKWCPETGSMMHKAAFPSQLSPVETLFWVILSKPFADFLTFCGSICPQFATISGSSSAES
jgi:hypothetical protein